MLRAGSPGVGEWLPWAAGLGRSAAADQINDPLRVWFRQGLAARPTSMAGLLDILGRSPKLARSASMSSSGDNHPNGEPEPTWRDLLVMMLVLLGLSVLAYAITWALGY
jgi:hypothetical protein